MKSMNIERLSDFNEILVDLDFGPELHIYTEQFLEDVADNLQTIVDEIKAELEWRENEHVRKANTDGVRCSDKECPCNEVEEEEGRPIHTCDCGDEHEVEEEEE